MLFIFCRPKWCIKYGTKYSKLDYLLIGWNEDGLPLFGRVQDILCINNSVLFCVLKYETLGIDSHYHSFFIRRTEDKDAFWLSELIDYHPLQAHQLSNNNLYITFRSHIEKVVLQWVIPFKKIVMTCYEQNCHSGNIID